MRLYGRDPSGRYYQVQQTGGGRYREAPRGLPAKPVLKLLLLLAVIIVIAIFHLTHLPGRLRAGPTGNRTPRGGDRRRRGVRIQGASGRHISISASASSLASGLA